MSTRAKLNVPLKTSECLKGAVATAVAYPGVPADAVIMALPGAKELFRMIDGTAPFVRYLCAHDTSLPASGWLRRCATYEAGFISAYLRELGFDAGQPSARDCPRMAWYMTSTIIAPTNATRMLQRLKPVTP